MNNVRTHRQNVVMLFNLGSCRYAKSRIRTADLLQRCNIRSAKYGRDDISDRYTYNKALGQRRRTVINQKQRGIDKLAED